MSMLNSSNPGYNHTLIMNIITEVDDVVNTTLFLLSDKASMINGAILPVDGGLATHI